MNDILENIVGWFPEIAEAKFWGVLITGGLFTYLTEVSHPFISAI